MKTEWEVDEKTTVEAELGTFGKKVVRVNGEEVHRVRGFRSKIEIPFDLSGGRHATVSLVPQTFGYPRTELRVDGRMMIETPKTPIQCRSCNTIVKPYDRFCLKCGHAMPTGEDHQNLRRVREATGAIKALAVLFALFGAVMFLVTDHPIRVGPAQAVDTKNQE